jgi:hypothetical protein
MCRMTAERRWGSALPLDWVLQRAMSERVGGTFVQGFVRRVHQHIVSSGALLWVQGHR